MKEQMILYLVSLYVIFLAFIHVKVAELIYRKRQNGPRGGERLSGWMLAILAMAPVQYIVPEDIEFFMILFLIISLVWAAVYFLLIKRNESEV